MDLAGNSELTAHKKTAIVLFQLGGPDSLESVELFLYNLFTDPDIIDFPFLLRQPLAKLISRKRSLKVQENYKSIGGKSPVLELTRLQANALESRCLHQEFNVKVFIAMRYWHPMTDAVVKEIKAGEFEQAILLPLYPQFSQATTYSSINEWNRQARKYSLGIPAQLICCYPNHPALIEAFVENINLVLRKFSNISQEDIDLVFSAHGVPVSYIHNGDPYQLQVEETVRNIAEHGQWKSPHTICYQSKVGPMKWLKPSLVESVERLALEGRRHLLVIPVSFVTDHIETLHEINIEVRRHALANGIRQFEVIPALNDHPKFIECLSDLVVKQLTHAVEHTACNMLWEHNNSKWEPKKCPRFSSALRRVI